MLVGLRRVLVDGRRGSATRFCWEHYNLLPELREAKDQFKSLGASEILFTEIGLALVRHYMEIF